MTFYPSKPRPAGRASTIRGVFMDGTDVYTASPSREVFPPEVKLGEIAITRESDKLVAVEFIGDE